MAGLLRKRVTSENALELFTALDPGQLGYLTADSLRMIRGHLALCDYRELVKSDLGDLNQTLLAADTDGNQLVAEYQKNLADIGHKDSLGMWDKCVWCGR